MIPSMFSMQFNMVNRSYLLEGEEGSWNIYLLDDTLDETGGRGWLEHYDYIWEALAAIDKTLYGQPPADAATDVRLDAIHQLILGTREPT